MLQDDKILQVAYAPEEGAKKDDGINSILALLKDLAAFQKSVEKCIELQGDEGRKRQIEAFYRHLDAMGDQLLDITKVSFRARRQEREKGRGKEDNKLVQKKPTVHSPTIPVTGFN